MEYIKKLFEMILYFAIWFVPPIVLEIYDYSGAAIVWLFLGWLPGMFVLDYLKGE